MINKDSLRKMFNHTRLELQKTKNELSETKRQLSETRDDLRIANDRVYPNAQVAPDYEPWWRRVDFGTQTDDMESIFAQRIKPLLRDMSKQIEKAMRIPTCEDGSVIRSSELSEDFDESFTFPATLPYAKPESDDFRIGRANDYNVSNDVGVTAEGDLPVESGIEPDKSSCVPDDRIYKETKKLTLEETRVLGKTSGSFIDTKQAAELDCQNLTRYLQLLDENKIPVTKKMNILIKIVVGSDGKKRHLIYENLKVTFQQKFLDGCRAFTRRANKARLPI